MEIPELKKLVNATENPCRPLGVNGHKLQWPNTNNINSVYHQKMCQKSSKASLFSFPHFCRRDKDLKSGAEGV